jgi:GR25 family glycosyltransferase involved in LPS biosynthesis
MKSYVITIMSMPESVEMAERCIASIPSSVDPAPYMFPAITPDDDPIMIAGCEGLDLSFFDVDAQKYSRFERCVSAFLSHYSLWKQCAEGKEDFLIFEHDAVVNGNIPSWIPHKGCISIGKPSYGKYNTPAKLGVNPLTSKRYFPGAHAYIVSPKGARALVTFAKDNAAPTDVFLHLNNFPFLEEYYPWAAEARDTFSTIQNEGGCLAKHGYKKGSYKLL